MRANGRNFACLTLATSILASACEGPTILSDYGSAYSVWGYSRGTRSQLHNGVDFAGGFGEPVLAAADGRIARTGTMGPQCGVGVAIRHEFGLPTAYCHMAMVQVVPGAKVKRGQTIGTIGMSREYGGVTHVHFMLGPNGDHDPMKYIVGCYELGVEYQADKVVLTYPVSCRN